MIIYAGISGNFIQIILPNLMIIRMTEEVLFFHKTLRSSSHQQSDAEKFKSQDAQSRIQMVDLGGALVQDRSLDQTGQLRGRRFSPSSEFSLPFDGNFQASS